MPDGSTALRERAENLIDDADILEQADKLYERVVKAFDDQRERTDKIMDLWDLYECQLGRFQNYSGMSKIFLPIIRNGVNALVVRYVNQLFPNSGRHVECVTGEEKQPYALLSLIEHYIAESKIRTNAAPALLTNGQIEGQYNAYFHWQKSQRTVVTREKQPIKVDGMPSPEAGHLEITIEEEIEEACPLIEVLHDADVVVFPATADSVEQALEVGGGCAVVRRWTEPQIEKMIDDGEIAEDIGKDLIAKIGIAEGEQKTRDTEKKLSSAIGIHVSRGKGYVVAFEVWHKFEVEGEKRRLCRAFFVGGGENKTAGVTLNPFWNDRCPLHSAPVKKLPGVFKGEPPVAACQDLQVLANDAINEAADMLYYQLAPVIAADPQKVSKWKELVADIGAVWPIDPDGVKMIEWPMRTREAMEVVASCKSAIFEILQVNPAIMPQQTGKPGAKRNQAEVALEQQVELLQTADAVTGAEQEVFTPYVQWTAELDHQFRDKEILVREYGEIGLKADMENIAPIQWGKRWEVRWVGVETQRNAANIQQMISWFAAVNQIPPDKLKGWAINMVPALEQSVGVIFGPRLGRETFVAPQEAMDPETENELLMQGDAVPTHPADNDQKHLIVHQQIPPSPQRDQHMAMHAQGLRMKQQAAIAMQMQQAMGGGPGQQQPPSRRGRGPKAGGQARPPRQQFGPPGMIRPDQMPKAGALMPPRKTA